MLHIQPKSDLGMRNWNGEMEREKLSPEKLFFTI